MTLRTRSAIRIDMFHRMELGDALYLVGLVVFAAVGFALPGLRSGHLAGVSLFGWWMAALMLLAPIVALSRVLKR